MTSPGSIVVLGDIATDVVARLSQPIAVGSDATASVWTGGGGSGANVAAWLAHSGAAVSFIGRVGDDDSGRARTAELAQAGVDVHISVDAQHATGTVVVLVTPDGERTMLPDRGANLAISADDVPDNLIRHAAHLHVSGYSLFDARPRTAAVAAINAARTHGVPFSVDPASAQPLRIAGPEAFLQWTAGADLCLPNVAEAHVLTGTTDAAAALRRLSARYRETVITLGDGGAVWSDGSAVVHAPARPVAVADTTGAGDAFTAGYLHAGVSGKAPQQCLDAGIALATQVVGRRGARP